ncbi:hypothetical protein ILUMI_13330 [Ignelater luminosus]|uniref:CCHC-type domain-containing protein n=1 Tax=Ignelater luminosus TaxID=2038154 RepID=A0A8K0G5X6_IGNLU|nr:hypothetical protein ILUMI_13330 [Ignelater luminosus]
MIVDINRLKSETERHADSKTKQNVNMEQVDTKWIIEQTFNQQEKHFQQMKEMMQMFNLNSGNKFSVEFKKSIELFYGRETALKAQDWLETLKDVSKLNSWPDELKLEAARANLFEEEFKQTFIGSVSKADLWKIMVQRMQKKNEDVCDYFLEKVRLCKDLKLSFEEIKEQVLEGLWLKDLSVYLLSISHQDKNSLFDDIKKFQRLQQARLSRIKTNMDNKDLKQQLPGKNVTVPAEFNKSESTSNNKQRSEETIRCFNCAGSGHHARECKRPKRDRGSCYECGGMDHRLAQSPRARRQQDRQESQSTTTLLVHSPDDEIPPTNITLAAQQMPTPAWTIPVFIEFDQYKFCLNSILDSGSTISLLNVKILEGKKYELESVGSDFNYSGINGSKLHAFGHININIITSNVQVDNVNFYVVPTNTIFFDCLLGRDFMNRNDLNVSFSGNVVTVNLCKRLDDFNEASNEIMSINYVETNETNEIHIEQDVLLDVKQHAQELFIEKYIKPVRPFRTNDKTISRDPYLWELNEATRDFIATNGTSQNDDAYFKNFKIIYNDKT